MPNPLKQNRLLRRQDPLEIQPANLPHPIEFLQFDSPLTFD